MASAPRLALGLLLTGTLACASPAAPDSIDAASPTDTATASSSSPSEANTVVDLTNAERSDAGMPAFTRSAKLMQAAQLHAEQMAALETMAHVLPDGEYPEPKDRLAAVGYVWQAYGENVAFNQSTPAQVIGAWMGSSGHRANILSTQTTEMGAGFARDTDGRPYGVQVFGRPAP